MSTNETPLFQAILNGDAGTVKAEITQKLAENISAQTLLEEYLVPAMSEVGRLYEEGEYYVPELLIASRAMQEGMKILNPILKASGIEKVGRVVIGTVFGDLHDIGKNIVASMLEGAGFEVIDLGINVSSEKFIEAAKEKPGTIIGLSALLTTTMPQMRQVIDDLKQNGLRDSVKVIIGGAPVTQDFANDIGADGYSENAPCAVQLALSLI